MEYNLELASFDPALIPPKERSQGHLLGISLLFFLLAAVICGIWIYGTMCRIAFNKGLDTGVHIGARQANLTVNSYIRKSYEDGARSVDQIILSDDGTKVLSSITDLKRPADYPGIRGSILIYKVPYQDSSALRHFKIGRHKVRIKEQ